MDSDSRGLKQEHSEWEFFHIHFQRGKPEELHLIKRKVPISMTFLKELHPVYTSQDFFCRLFLKVEDTKIFLTFCKIY